MHATDFLQSSEDAQIPPLVVIHGPEAYLKTAAQQLLVRRTLGETTGAAGGITRLAGRVADWRSVHDDLVTVSMFGTKRIVIVEEADDFVSATRDSLERYFDRPARQSVLVLEVKTWRNNTRLAKKLVDAGLELDCSELKGAALTGWLVRRAERYYGRRISRDAVTLLVELAGTSLALLEQELAKLAAYVGDRAQITADDVRTLVGGWRAETTWRMTDAVRDGRPDVALAALDKLLRGGEAPQRIFGGVAFVFRKTARATELSRQGLPLRAALQQAGVHPRELQAAEAYLRRLGRTRAERIRARLLEADGALKGGSRLPERLQLERLLLELTGPVHMRSRP